MTLKRGDVIEARRRRRKNSHKRFVVVLDGPIEAKPNKRGVSRVYYQVLFGTLKKVAYFQPRIDCFQISLRPWKHVCKHKIW